MKLIPNLLWPHLIACLMLSQTSYADTSCPTETTDEQIFCPKQIECAEEGNLNFCKASESDMRYWNMGENGRIEKGNYTFAGVTSSYQSPLYTHTTCTYTNNSAGFIKYIYVVSKAEAEYLEIIPKKGKWTIMGYSAQCPSSNNEECPLTRTATFIIQNVNQISVNDVIIPCRPQEAAYRRKITYEDALKYCFNENMPICNFDIKQGSDKIASVIVDIKNKMKILKVISIPQSRYEAKLLDGLNSIEVIDKNAPKQ
jgi:hypothetical protein